jgi:hypothetical protein
VFYSTHAVFLHSSFRKDVDGKGGKKHDHHKNDHHKTDKAGHGHHEESKPQKKEEEEKENPNLTKRELKMMEKLHAKIEYHEIRDELDEANKIREQIIAIEQKAIAKAKTDKESARTVSPS